MVSGVFRVIKSDLQLGSRGGAVLEAEQRKEIRVGFHEQSAAELAPESAPAYGTKALLPGSWCAG
jgi:hypothetical protein